MKISDIIEDQVKKHNGNKSAVARLVGVSSQTLGHYLRGRNNPKPDFYIKWKEIFKQDLLEMTKTNVSKTDSIPVKEDLNVILKELHERQERTTATCQILLNMVAELEMRVSGRSLEDVQFEIEKALNARLEARYDQLSRKQ